MNSAAIPLFTVLGLGLGLASRRVGFFDVRVSIVGVWVFVGNCQLSVSLGLEACRAWVKASQGFGA